MRKEETYATLNEAYFSEECHEKEILERLPRLLAGCRYFVDVGASLGLYTRAAARCMRRGRIVAIEADPVRHEELARNAVLWAAETGIPIEALFAAVGSTPGEVTFYTTNSNVSGGLFPHTVRTPVDWQEIRGPCTTLDDRFADDPPDFVKVDIEGGEYRMLLGATRLLDQHRTAFLIEIHPWSDPEAAKAPGVLQVMREFGYWPVPLFQHTLFFPFGLRLAREKVAAAIRSRLRGR